MNNSLVSVIIPCFNAQKTIRHTIESVLNQTHQDLELLIVNDGSTDSSLDLIQGYTESDHRVSVISIPNQGVSVARNTGIQHAKGEFIAFLDADDLWHSEKLEKQVDYMNNNLNVGVCFSKVEFLSQEGVSLNQFSKVPDDGLQAAGLLTENLTCTTSNVFCRKQVITTVGLFNTTMSFAEDQEWLLRVTLLSSWKIMGLQSVHVGYRTNQGSLSSQLDRMEQGWESLVDQVREYAPLFVDHHYHSAKAIFLRYLARRSLRQDDSPEIGLNYIKRAWFSDKWLYFKQPKRTIATLLCLYIKHMFYIGKSAFGLVQIK